MRGLPLAYVCFLLLSVAPAALAQQRAPAPLPEDHPVVGLVLSGGAAKGLTHTGAIRVIESAGVPVDVVIDGEAEVLLPRNENHVLGEGDVFGELALLTQAKRSASVVARTYD